LAGPKNGQILDVLESKSGHFSEIQPSPSQFSVPDLLDLVDARAKMRYNPTQDSRAVMDFESDKIRHFFEIRNE